MWCALTSFFLDTELTEDEVQHIAAVAQQAGYSPPEVEQMLLRELVPVFGANLLSTAGEWAPWPNSFVEDRMRQWFARSCHTNWPTGVLVRPMLRTDWARLKQYLTAAELEPSR